MDVSICIVNWNTKELLCSCIKSIYAKTKSVEYEIIVVDNNSSDGSCDLIEKRFPAVILIRSENNLGFARGCNLAVQNATGKYVLYLNPDTELVTNAIYGMLELLEYRTDVGAVGCRILNPDGSIQLTCAAEYPSPRNEICSLLGLDRLFPNALLFSARELKHWDHKDSRNVECLSGACIMLSRELVHRLKGFDHHFFMYGEDIDLCMRVSEMGLALHYLSSEIIYHYEGSSSRMRGRDFAPLRQRAANHRLLATHFGLTHATTYRVAVLIGSFVRFVGMGVASPFILASGKMDYEAVMSFLERYGKLLMWAAGIRQANRA